jgi:hypothetical protein
MIACVPFLVLLEPTPLLYAGVIAGHVVLSLVVFRYSRAIFLAVDHALDPGAAAGGGDDRGDAAVPARPRPAPGLARRRSVRREPASVT